MSSGREKFLLIVALGLWIGVVGAFAAKPASAPVPGSAPASDDEPEYVYTPALRDPFFPLAGAAAAGPAKFADKQPEGPFNPAAVQLKGILRTSTGRWAVLTATTGERFVVENGKVLDSKRKPVDGFVGIIKAKSLVLIGRDNQVTELKLKRDQQKSDSEKPR